MAHPAQHSFFAGVREKFPKNFTKVRVLDCGSLDVNGSLKDLFTNCEYIGIDIVPGRNVDIVGKVHEYDAKPFDTVVSGEMLEHDEYWELSLKNMYRLCKPGGLIAISAAGEGRPEHGTTRTGSVWGTSADYYRNVTEDMISSVYKKDMFTQYFLKHLPIQQDIYFFGIKVV